MFKDYVPIRHLLLLVMVMTHKINSTNKCSPPFVLVCRIGGVVGSYDTVGVGV